MTLQQIMHMQNHPVDDDAFAELCRRRLDQTGVLTLPGFLQDQTVEAIYKEGLDNRDQAYFCKQSHNVYLTPPDPKFSNNHPRNRQVVSSKGCICDDVIGAHSALRQLYNDAVFKRFLCHVLGEQDLYNYADPLSSINLHYAEPGQELGWHFDNSSFAITLMIQPAGQGGDFEYMGGLRNSDEGFNDYDGITQVLEGRADVKKLNMQAGALVLFRGRDALHRVAPVAGPKTRMLVVLAYNSEPGIALSEDARQMFFGRLGSDTIS